jgi:hypothetical protein
VKCLCDQKDTTRGFITSKANDQPVGAHHYTFRVGDFLIGIILAAITLESCKEYFVRRLGC